MEINGLPVVVLVMLGGIGLVVALWLLMRFGRTIARFLAGGAILIAVVLGVLALGGQSAANYQTARAATEAAQAAKTASTGLSMTAIASTLCIGGLGTMTLGAVATIGVLWWRLQMVERMQEQERTSTRARVQQPETDAPVVWVVGDGQPGGIDLAGVDLSQWGWG